MTGPARASHDESPARLHLRPMPAHAPWDGLAVERLELISRGDIVTGVCARPRAGEHDASGERAPALLLLHDAGSHASGPAWRRVAAWIARGPHAYAIDLPLHGHRASPKLSERLVSALASLDRGIAPDRNGEVLVEEALAQARCDVGRLLDGALATGAVDPQRVALVAIGFGARVAAALLAADRRPCAAVLVRDATAVADGPAHAGTAADATAVLRLATRQGATDWAEEAEKFLASRIGF